MRSRLVFITTLSALATGGGIAYFTRPVPAAANYTPPDLVDGQTFLLRKTTGRVQGGGFSCVAVCRSAEAGGTRPRACLLVPGMDAGTFAGADVECLIEADAACIPQAVHECARPVVP